MKERPIRFSAPMVRAIIDGSKTQTRRVVKPLRRWSSQYPILDAIACAASHAAWWWDGLHSHVGIMQPCPYGKPGDRLWVRETWAETDRHDGTPVVAYRAGGCIGVGRTQRDGPDHLIRAFAWDDAPEGGIRWRASIHMPRWASRILLEVTDVRVERLQDISEADAQAEGVKVDGNGHAVRDDVVNVGGARTAFAELWESINGPDSWATNPWVWVVEFRRI